MPREKQPLSREDQLILNKARVKRCNGASYKELASEFGKSKNWFRYRLDTTYRRRWRDGEEPPSALTQAELRERLALVPRDTRDLTGRIMGDPIPGDQRRVMM